MQQLIPAIYDRYENLLEWIPKINFTHVFMRDISAKIALM